MNHSDSERRTVMTRNITERKHEEEELRALVDAIPQLVWIAGPDGSITYNNQRSTDYLAMPFGQDEGHGWRAGVHPDDQQRVWDAWQTSIQTGVPYEVEFRLQDGTSGAYRWFLTRALPMRDEAGQITKWIGTGTNIDEQKRTEEALRQSQEIMRTLMDSSIIGIAIAEGEEVKELEQRKDDFITMASHELKTPLTLIKMQVQLVRRRLVKQGLHEAAAALLQVEEPVKQLERLVGELLDVSKIQAGRLEYVQEPVDLEALLCKVAQTMQQMNTTHAVVVRGAAPGTLMGDKGRLEQVFINLISNAMKYSPGGTTVEINLSASTETVTVSVCDHGIGIQQEQYEKIFDRFYRASDLRQGAVPGLGMGLYIVAEIVRYYGGTVRIESVIGHGSTFHVTLPLKSPITNGVMQCKGKVPLCGV
jgi:PAS domain S-box-containing protein